MLRVLVCVLSVGRLFAGATAPTLSPSFAPSAAPSSARSSQYSIKLFAGTGAFSSTGNGGQATAATFFTLRTVWFDTAGVAYLVESGAMCVRTVDTSGIVHSFAGVCGTPGSSGDGGAASSALFSYCPTIFVSTVGNQYIPDLSNNKVRMVSTSGIISAVIGTGTAATSGDGGKATAAAINAPHSVWGNSVGSLYIGSYEDHLVRSMDSSNIIHTLAGMHDFYLLSL